MEFKNKKPNLFFTPLKVRKLLLICETVSGDIVTINGYNKNGKEINNSEVLLSRNYVINFENNKERSVKIGRANLDLSLDYCNSDDMIVKMLTDELTDEEFKDVEETLKFAVINTHCETK
jgi:hypothetical protein